jgi:hypothetical protein
VGVPRCVEVAPEAGEQPVRRVVGAHLGEPRSGRADGAPRCQVVGGRGLPRHVLDDEHRLALDVRPRDDRRRPDPRSRRGTGAPRLDVERVPAEPARVAREAHDDVRRPGPGPDRVVLVPAGERLRRPVAETQASGHLAGERLDVLLGCDGAGHGVTVRPR